MRALLRPPRFDPWIAAALLVALLVALPLATVLGLALSSDTAIWSHLAATVLPGYLRTTLALMLGVGLGTFLIGTATAWLVTMCEFPSRRIMRWALLLPFAVPAYLIAYIYTDLLEFAGPVQQTLRGWFGWQRPADYWFPPIRSLGGAIAMMSLVMYPYVYLLARAAFLEQSPHLTEVGRSLGRGPWRCFFSVSLPMARPAIAVGLALVLMETLNDYGTVSFFAVPTLTAGLYDVWLNMGDLGGGAQIASLALIFVALLLTLERAGRRRQRQTETASAARRRAARYRLRGGRAWLAAALCWTVLTLGFVVPVAVLCDYAWRYFEQSWTAEFRGYAFNSLLLSSLTAMIALAVGVLLAYGRRLHGSPLLRSLVRFASLGYAVPGAVLALGVLIPLARFDNALDAYLRDSFGVSTGLLLSGSVFAIVFAYLTRFLAVAVGAVESSLGKITPSMDMAARSLGRGPLATLRRVHLPLIRGGLLTAALVVFVDCMKELPATLILRPFNFDTLATHVYIFASDGLFERSALAALLIVAVGLVPMLLLSRSVDGGDRRSDIIER